jgi:hypothetical protein
VYHHTPGRLTYLFAELEPASEDMQAFWKYLPDAQWYDDDTVLQLSEGTNFLGIPRYGDTLMMRTCYTAFDDMLESHFECGGEGFAVVGNSG